MNLATIIIYGFQQSNFYQNNKLCKMYLSNNAVLPLGNWQRFHERFNLKIMITIFNKIVAELKFKMLTVYLEHFIYYNTS